MLVVILHFFYRKHVLFRKLVTVLVRKIGNHFVTDLGNLYTKFKSKNGKLLKKLGNFGYDFEPKIRKFSVKRI